MNRHPFARAHRAQFIHRIADHVNDAAQGLFAHRHGDGPAKINGFHATHHAVCRLHGDAAHAAFAEMLLHFQNDFNGRGHLKAFAGDAQRLVNRRHGRFGELHVHRGSGDLNDFADVFFCHGLLYSRILLCRAEMKIAIARS